MPFQGFVSPPGPYSLFRIISAASSRDGGTTRTVCFDPQDAPAVGVGNRGDGFAVFAGHRMVGVEEELPVISQGEVNPLLSRPKTSSSGWRRAMLPNSAKAGVSGARPVIFDVFAGNGDGRFERAVRDGEAIGREAARDARPDPFPHRRQVAKPGIGFVAGGPLGTVIAILSNSDGAGQALRPNRRS